MEIIGGAELGGCEPHGHYIKAGSGLDTETRGELDVSAHIKGLGKPLVLNKLLCGTLIGVALGIVEAIAEIHAPGRVAVHIIYVSARDIFSGDGVVVYTFI